MSNEARSLAQMLMEYRNNPHHINPMSESFRKLCEEAAEELRRLASTHPMTTAEQEREKVMSNVLPFTFKGEPMDDVTMCTLSINGKGEIDLVINAECIDTAEQHNWLIAKIVESMTRLVDRKKGVS